MYAKAFRLFVSSTFADFAQEREVLRSKVFPALDAYCAARGFQFLSIDLRWGVNEEAQLDQRTAEICLGEVRAAKGYPPPNFLIMIGDRYGLVPLPYAIAQDEFEAVLSWLEDRDQHDSARALSTVYQHDENHLIPCGLSVPERHSSQLLCAYTLRSRQDELPELRSAEAWAKMEARLRGVLQEAADQLLKLGRIDAAAHQKYFLSLTEHEIIHGLPRYGDSAIETSSPRPLQGSDGPEAIAFIREFVASSSTQGVIRDSITSLRRLIANRRRGSEPPPGLIERAPRLEALKTSIRRVLPNDSIITASTIFGGGLDATYFADFAAAIQSKLEGSIDRHIVSVLALEQAPDFRLQSERGEHHRFAEQKRKIFVGRNSNRSMIASYIAGHNDHPLIVHGPSGFGKSALMARAIADAEACNGAPVIYRFIGASAASSDIRSLLVSVVEDLASHGIGQKPSEFEHDANKFNDQIKAFLSSITKPAIIFLDAIDQLRNPYRLGWFPAKLSTALKLVISVLDDEAFETDSGICRNLRQRLPAEAFLQIEPLVAQHGHIILTALEREAGRRLQDGQRAYIVAQFEKAGSSPLYLRTAFEIARSWRGTDTPGKGHYLLADNTSALIAQFIRDLSDVHHHEPELVTRTLGYLTAAKNGLSVKELTDVLSRDRDVMAAISSEQHGAHTDKLPASVWLRLNRQLKPFLTEKSIDDQPLLQFFHRQIANVAREHHYESVKQALHGALANYFEARVIRGDATATTYDKRTLSELPHQLHYGENKSRLDRILLSPGWMQQKLVALGPQILSADYEQFGHTRMHNAIGRTLRLITGIVARDADQLLPQLFGRLLSYPDPQAPDFLQDVRRLIKPPALLPERATLTPLGAETARLEGHASGASSLAVLPDGRLASASRDTTIRLWDVTTGAETAQLVGHRNYVNTLFVLPDGRLASGAGFLFGPSDNTIRLWDVTTGTETGRLDGHNKAVNALAVLPDGRLASGSDDYTIRLWDVTTGAEVARLEGHTAVVRWLWVLPDGRLASGSNDGSIRLWDATTGVECAQFNCHRGTADALVVLPDGRLAGSDSDNTIRLWDFTTGAECARLHGHAYAVKALAILPDGKLASGSVDATIRLWDVATGTETARLDGHTRSVDALVLLPDGRLASGSDDHTIRLWDTGADATRIVGHTGSVTALTLLPDGRLASCSYDQLIRLWDTRTGAETAQLKGHTCSIYAVVALPTGRLASGSGNMFHADDIAIRLWDARTGAQIARFEGHANSVKALTLLPDGRLASGSSDETVRIWDVTTGVETARLEGHTAGVTALAILRDGRLASAAAATLGIGDNSIRLWDLRTTAETARLEGHASAVNALAVLADGRLASGSDDFTIRLWDVTTGVETARLEGHTWSVNALAVIPNGKLASGSGSLLGSDDNTIRLWDVRSAKEIARIEVDAAVRCLAALPDNRLVAGDNMGRIHWLEIVDCRSLRWTR